jgi:hypothetical protein
MRELNNNTKRDLSAKEHRGIVRAAEILSRAFKRKVFASNVNAMQENPGEIWGIAFSFDLTEVPPWPDSKVKP